MGKVLHQLIDPLPPYLQDLYASQLVQDSINNITVSPESAMAQAV